MARHLLRASAALLGPALVSAFGAAALCASAAVVTAVLFAPLPFREPQELVRLWMTSPESSALDVSAANYLDLLDRTSEALELAAYVDAEVVTTGGAPARIRLAQVTHDLLPLLGVGPSRGRALRSEDYDESARVVLVSRGLWQRRFAERGSVAGASLSLDGDVYDVVGVLPEGAGFPHSDTDVWVPLRLRVAERSRGRDGPLSIVGRLRPGVSLEDAQASLDAAAAELRARYPVANDKKGARVAPIRQALIPRYREVRASAMVLAVAAGLLFLAAGVNSGGLLALRSLERSSEFATRMTLGASANRIRGLVAFDAAFVCVLGTTAGALLSDPLVRLVEPFLASHGFLFVRPNLAASTLVGVAAASFVIAFVAGIAVMPSPDGVLRSRLGPRAAFAGQGRRQGVYAAVLCAQIAAVTFLVALAALLASATEGLLSGADEIEPEGLFAAEVELPISIYPTLRSHEEAFGELRDRIEGTRRVSSVTTVYPLPLSGIRERVGVGLPLAGAGSERTNDVAARWVGAGYFETVRLPLLRGRAFARTDTVDSEPVVIVDELLADRLGPSALGSSLRLRPGTRMEATARVVGIAARARYAHVAEGPEPTLYLPHAQHGTRKRFVLLRATGSDPELAGSVLERLRGASTTIPILGVTTLDRSIARTAAPWRASAAVAAAVALAALSLSIAGVYGSVAFVARDRRLDVATRLALGARARHVIGLLARAGLAPVALGIGIGAGGAFLAVPLARPLLHAAGSLSVPWHVAVALVVVALAGALAAMAPLLEASRTDPAALFRDR